MKEFHIISSGVSLLQNAQRAGVITPDKKIEDEEFWKSLLNDPTEIQKLLNYVKQNPYESSAELNTFLRAVKKDKDPSSNRSISFWHKKPHLMNSVEKVITDYLKELGYNAYLYY